MPCHATQCTSPAADTLLVCACASVGQKNSGFTLVVAGVNRYPRFTDALADVDDALSMVHLFASLPAEKRIQTKRTQLCLRLCREWQSYVSHTRCLQKTFLSVKGVYYQARVQGVPITWVVPHRFSQEMPSDVDYRIMLTFLEFYEALLQFVFFKLYHTQNLRYPPPVRADMDDAGAHLAVVDMEAAAATASESGGAGAGAGATTDGTSKQIAVSADRASTLSSKLRSIQDGAQGDGDEDGNSGEDTGSSDDSSSEDDEILALEGDEEAAAEARIVREKAREQKRFTKLFNGLTFFLSREVRIRTCDARHSPPTSNTVPAALT